MMLAAVMGYFAIINRRIPPKRAGLYVALFFLGAATMAIANLPGVISPAFNFLFLFFPVANMEAFTDQNSVVGPAGLPDARVRPGRSGRRGLLRDAGPLWYSWGPGADETLAVGRVLLFCTGRHVGRLPVSVYRLADDFRAAFLFGAVASYPVAAACDHWVAGGRGSAGRLCGPVAAVYATLPCGPAVYPARPVARMDAQGSTEWRLQMWKDLVPEIPQYLLVGKGYSFSANEQA